MNELGVSTVWVKDAKGTLIKTPQDQTTAEQEHQVVILQVVTESNVTLRLLYRREDFSRMLAHPNDSDPTEVAVNMEE